MKTETLETPERGSAAVAGIHLVLCDPEPSLRPRSCCPAPRGPPSLHRGHLCGVDPDSSLHRQGGEAGHPLPRCTGRFSLQPLPRQQKENKEMGFFSHPDQNHTGVNSLLRPSSLRNDNCHPLPPPAKGRSNESHTRPSPWPASPWGTSGFFWVTETKGFGHNEAGSRKQVYSVAVLEQPPEFLSGLTWIDLGLFVSQMWVFKKKLFLPRSEFVLYNTF